MNVVFVDIDGVLNTFNHKEGIVDEMVNVLSMICKLYNCKVVVESTHKPNIYEDEEEFPLIKELYEKFNKYNIELLGFTPKVEIHKGCSTIEDWKDYEILYYLQTHPEIEHFCILDDNDFKDLVLLQEYLVEIDDNTGLTIDKVEEVGKVLKLENKYKNLHKRNNTK